MGPEAERKQVELVLSLPAKEKMSMFGRPESKVVRDAAGGDLCTTSQGTEVAEKQNINLTALDAETPDINVTDGVKFGGGDNGDTTDDSSGSLSSFNDTFSGGDGALGVSDNEINSEFRGSSQSAWVYPGCEEAFRTRKKKVTTHWRNYIRPLMWRCKWAELQMRKFQIQASMYSRLLEEYDQAKQTQKENFCAESQCSRSLPFPHQMKRRKIMRRVKRKRVEDTTDLVSYFSQHNLFAYFDNKETSTDHARLTNGYVNPMIPPVRNGGVNLAENDALEQFDDDETSLERILTKIDSMQSHVHNLTTKVDQTINEHHVRFSYLDKLSLLTTPSGSGASTAQDPTTPSSDKDKVFITSPSTTTQPASGHHVEEASMSVILVTADQLVDSLPDVLESADQLVVAKKSDDAEDKTQITMHPVTEKKPCVYVRSKKRKMLPEKQSNGSSSVPQSQNERSSLFLASRYTALRNIQKKRGKRKRASLGKKTFGGS